MSYALRGEDLGRRTVHVESRATAAPDRQPAIASPYFNGNGLLSRTVALLILVASMPLIVATILAVKITSPGPAIFKQTRVGRRGRSFVMYKIRTMRVDAEAATGPVWTQTNDPRVTWLGRWIRKLHLDEFPQLINVIKGEMAIIGPRPERPEFTQKLQTALPGYLDRLAVRPGITGLAQINLPPDTDLESVRRKLSLDLMYVREGSLWLDLRILACTFARLFALRGPQINRVLGIARQPDEVPAAGDLLAHDLLGSVPRSLPRSHDRRRVARHGTPQTFFRTDADSALADSTEAIP
ncbi:MAG TPA: sugar transferase [Pirellulales bacterium]|nr:sugar transferase [Pirellulales bacterium]